uniref:MGC172218 protein n=1 Tax=Danio rerio TaxID=7955 RepID=A8KBB5_DANRE|nr:zgc:172218 precursor [Danio rerio]AAI54048.1 MGC172218 protein [Danio rerio]|eukprot:NP_001103589.1 L-rhamnose-binding lectin CSL3-like precursor [Danio rerio]
MVFLSLLLTLILLNSSLLISASGGHDGHEHGHGGHDHGRHDHGHRHDYDYCRRSSNTVTACEGSILRLSCPVYSKIRVLAANYGRTDRKTCIKNRPPGEIRNTNCRSSSSLSIVSSWCDGRQSCNVPATNSVFSDPCYGTYKYLAVKYCCTRRRS